VDGDAPHPRAISRRDSLAATLMARAVPVAARARTSASCLISFTFMASTVDFQVRLVNGWTEALVEICLTAFRQTEAR